MTGTVGSTSLVAFLVAIIAATRARKGEGGYLAPLSGAACPKQVEVSLYTSINIHPHYSTVVYITMM